MNSETKNIIAYKKPIFWMSILSVIGVIGIGYFLFANRNINTSSDKIVWADALSENEVKSIEMVLSPADRTTQYKKFPDSEFSSIIKIVNASKGQKVSPPDELGSTRTFYITTKDGVVHTYQNLSNTYLVIDDEYYRADKAWLNNSFRAFKGNASLPAGFFERVSGISSTYDLVKLGKNGNVLASLSSVTGKNKQLAEDIVFKAMAASSIDPAKDIASVDEYYMVRQILAKNNSKETHMYYLFALADGYYLQSDKEKSCVKIDAELCSRIRHAFQ
ncbi:MAG TPA: hypothetical protein VGK02_01490 [Candidatus Aquicultor sp.]|jgi:hypothetical protein